MTRGSRRRLIYSDTSQSSSSFDTESPTPLLELEGGGLGGGGGAVPASASAVPLPAGFIRGPLIRGGRALPHARRLLAESRHSSFSSTASMDAGPYIPGAPYHTELDRRYFGSSGGSTASPTMDEAAIRLRATGSVAGVASSRILPRTRRALLVDTSGQSSFSSTASTSIDEAVRLGSGIRSFPPLEYPTPYNPDAERRYLHRTRIGLFEAHSGPLLTHSLPSKYDMPTAGEQPPRPVFRKSSSQPTRSLSPPTFRTFTPTLMGHLAAEPPAIQPSHPLWSYSNAAAAARGIIRKRQLPTIPPIFSPHSHSTAREMFTRSQERELEERAARWRMDVRRSADVVTPPQELFSDSEVLGGRRTGSVPDRPVFGSRASLFAGGGHSLSFTDRLPPHSLAQPIPIDEQHDEDVRDREYEREMAILRRRDSRRASSSQHLLFEGHAQGPIHGGSAHEMRRRFSREAFESCEEERYHTHRTSIQRHDSSSQVHSSQTLPSTQSSHHDRRSSAGPMHDSSIEAGHSRKQSHQLSQEEEDQLIEEELAAQADQRLHFDERQERHQHRPHREQRHRELRQPALERTVRIDPGGGGGGESGGEESETNSVSKVSVTSALSNVSETRPAKSAATMGPSGGSGVGGGGAGLAPSGGPGGRSGFQVRIGRIGYKSNSSFRRFQRSEEVIPAELIPCLGGMPSSHAQDAVPGSSATRQSPFLRSNTQPERPHLHKQWSRDSATDQDTRMTHAYSSQGVDADRGSIHESISSESSFARAARICGTMPSQAGGVGGTVADTGDMSHFVENLGPGQIIGRQGLACPNLGDIQLSICERKGNLEVEVIRARGLQAKADVKMLPTPYVKVYLMKGRKCISKAKTICARRTLDPLYQQQLIFHEDYRGCVLQVTVWGDYGRMEKKVFMGVAQVVLDDLDLSNIAIGWYKLFHPSSLISLPPGATRNALMSTSMESLG